MNRARYIFPLLLCFFFTGCAPAVFIGGAVAGIGGYKYYEGALSVIYQASYDKTWNASIKALEDMEYRIEEKTQKLGSGNISTTGDNKTRVKISVKYVTQEETEVTIRVGIFGDESASNVIKDKIGSVLFKK